MKQLIEALNEAYADPQVRRNPQVASILFNGARELEQSQDTQAVVDKILKSLSLSYFNNDEPQVITELVKILNQNK